jgi:hypothetical protein
MKVAWMTWLPMNSGAAQQLRERLNGQGNSIELVFVEPQRLFNPHKCLELVAEMNRDYDAVAFTGSSEMVEAIRNYRIKNYQKEGTKFAQWFSLAIRECGNETRWCVVG